MIGRLLDNCEFELSDYISAQSEIISNGMYFRIQFKRSLKNFQIDICNQLFHRNFISVSENDYSNLLENFQCFSDKHFSYRYSNPLIVDSTSKIQFYLMDEIKNPTINELILEEYPNQGELVKPLFQSRSMTRYLGRADITEKLNSKKYFYIFVTNLKQPEIPSDFDFFMKNIYESANKRFNIDKQIGKAKEFGKQLNNNKLLNEIKKVDDLLKMRYCGVQKVIQYKYILEQLNCSLFDYSLRHYKNPLNTKRILASSKKYSHKFTLYKPDTSLRTFKMIMQRGEQRISKD